MNNKGLQLTGLAQGIDGGLAMNQKLLNSESLSESIKKQSELVSKRVEQLGKLATPTLPKFDTARIAGIAALGNTGAHLFGCFFCCRTLVG